MCAAGTLNLKTSNHSTLKPKPFACVNVCQADHAWKRCGFVGCCLKLAELLLSPLCAECVLCLKNQRQNIMPPLIGDSCGFVPVKTAFSVRS